MSIIEALNDSTFPGAIDLLVDKVSLLNRPNLPVYVNNVREGDMKDVFKLLIKAIEYFEIENTDPSDIRLLGLGLSMQYSSPFVWMAYKILIRMLPDETIRQMVERYGGIEPIKKWGDLEKHCCAEPWYVCGKRLHYLHSSAPQLDSVAREGLLDLFQNPVGMGAYLGLIGDGHLFPTDMKLTDVMRSPIFTGIVSQPGFMSKWAKMERDKWRWYNGNLLT